MVTKLVSLLLSAPTFPTITVPLRKVAAACERITSNTLRPYNIPDLDLTLFDRAKTLPNCGLAIVEPDELFPIELDLGRMALMLLRSTSHPLRDWRQTSIRQVAMRVLMLRACRLAARGRHR